VFSLSPEGQAWLVEPWRLPGGRGVGPKSPWTGSQLGAEANDPPRPEQMLVVAVPAATGFTTTRDWASFCATPGTLNPSMFPPGSAYHMVRYLVAPGTGAPGAEAAPDTVVECGGARRVPFP
jgi:hypothetical protein